MPFLLQEYKSIKNIKIQFFLINNLNFSTSKAQQLIAKGRIFDKQKNNIKNNQLIADDFIYIALFKGITRGLKPILEEKDFAIFDKPSGLLVHPTSGYCQYSLLDEIHYHFGDKASLAHRIDKETSGLILVSKNKSSSKVFGKMFENHQYIKKYLAIVQGEVKENFTINKPITKENKSIGVKMKTSFFGKESTTMILPKKYNKNTNQTLIQAMPKSGRQHQIRVHLDSVGHTIIGDPIYGVDKKIANSYLNKTLSKEDRLKHTKNNRLMLHSYYLEFSYQDKIYKIFSKKKF